MLCTAKDMEETIMARSMFAYFYGLYPFGFTGCLRCGA